MDQNINKSSQPSDQTNPDSKPLSKKLLDNVREELESIKPFPKGFHVFPHRSLVSFETQENKEKIILISRAHIIILIKKLLIIAFFSLLPILEISTPIISSLPTQFKFATIAGWYIVIFGIFLEYLLSWYYNVFIITDERIIDVDFLSLVYKRVSHTKIDKLEDVTHDQAGLFQTMFNYGDVEIQTAGSQQEFEAIDIPYPAKVSRIINQLILQEEQEKIEGRIS